MLETSITPVIPILLLVWDDTNLFMSKHILLIFDNVADTMTNCDACFAEGDDQV